MPKAETMAVVAVKGVVCPFPGNPGRFVGYRTANKAETEKGVFDHEVPDGKKYVIKEEPETVPNDRYWRRMIQQSAIKLYKDAPVKTKSGNKSGSGNNPNANIPNEGKE